MCHEMIEHITTAWSRSMPTAIIYAERTRANQASLILGPLPEGTRVTFIVEYGVFQIAPERIVLGLPLPQQKTTMLH